MSTDEKKASLVTDPGFAERLLRQVPEGIVVYDRDFCYVLFNHAAELMSGLPAETVLGKNAFELFPYLKDPDEEKCFHEALAGRAAISPNLPFNIPASGRKGYFEKHYFPLKDANERVQGIAAIVRDVTRRKNAEDALREQTKYVYLLQTVAMAANEAASVEEGIRRCVTEVCLHGGWPLGHAFLVDTRAPEGLVSTGVWFFRERGWFEQFQQATEKLRTIQDVGLAGRVFSTGKPVWTADLSQEISHSRRSAAETAGIRSICAFPILVGTRVRGVLEFFSMEKFVPSDSLLEVMAHVGAQVGRVLEREERAQLIKEKASRDEAERGEIRFRRLGEASPNLLWTTDPSGTFDFVNNRFLEYTGMEAQAVLGNGAILAVHPDDREMVLNQWKRAMKNGKAYENECRMRRKDGVYRWFLNRGVPLRDDNGEIWKWLGLATDIDAQKALEAKIRTSEERLKRQANELTRSNADLEQFAYVASHDLKEPLRMVASYLALIKKKLQGKLDAEGEEFIGYVMEGAERMYALIDDLLAYSRVNTKSVTSEEVESAEAFQAAVKNLGTSIKETGATVTSGPLPRVEGDRTQLIQLFQNLIANALKFRSDKPPEVRVEAKAQGEEWLFSVKDNGIGIDAKYVARIFVIFQRLHSRDKYPGTGIGLAICQRIVERHRGRIWVESEAGRGATFYFTLPRKNG